MQKRFELLAVISASLLIVLLAATGAAAATATDLRIRVTTGGHRVGGISLYSVTVTNRGPGATDAPLHVRDQLPPGLSLSGVVSADWACSASGATIDCVSNTPLERGRSTTFRLYLGVCDGAFPRVSSTFSVEYEGELNPTNNSITRSRVVRAGTCTAPLPTVTPRPTLPGLPGTPTIAPTATATPDIPPVVADLVLTKTASSTFVVGGVGSYSLSVFNIGPNPPNGTITVVDTLPEGLAYVSSSGAGWTCGAAGQTVTCTTDASLDVGTSTGFTLNVTVGSAAYPTVTNTAVAYYAGDPDVTDNSAQKPTTIRR